jgi:hypothetical protein
MGTVRRPGDHRVLVADPRRWRCGRRWPVGLDRAGELLRGEPLDLPVTGSGGDKKLRRSSDGRVVAAQPGPLPDDHPIQ